MTRRALRARSSGGCPCHADNPTAAGRQVKPVEAMPDRAIYRTGISGTPPSDRLMPVSVRLNGPKGPFAHVGSLDLVACTIRPSPVTAFGQRHSRLLPVT